MNTLAEFALSLIDERKQGGAQSASVQQWQDNLRQLAEEYLRLRALEDDAEDDDPRRMGWVGCDGRP